MQLHELQPKTKKTVAKRVGRGGKRGKTSGKGHKGQKARAGNSSRPEMRELIKKLPKLRGHGKNRAQSVNADKVLPTVINVSVLETHFTDGDAVSPKALVQKGLIRARRGSAPVVKILGNGELSKALKVSDCVVSKAAAEKITGAKGTIA